MTRTLYGLKPSLVFEASVHILRNNIPAAKKVMSGTLGAFEGVEQLLGSSTASEGHDNTVMSWMDGNNKFVPTNIDHFFERAFLQKYLMCPEMLTFIGFLEQAGIKNHNAFLEEAPSNHHEELLKKSNDYLLSALENENSWPCLSEDQNISRKILHWTIKNSNRQLRDHIYSVEQLDGVHALFMVLMSDFSVIKDINDVQNYLSRLEQAKMKFDLVAADMKKKREIGVMPPSVCLEKVHRSIIGTIKHLKTEGNSFVSTVKQKFKDSTGEELPKEMTDSIQTKINNFVIPSYEVLKSEVEECLKCASDDAGVWKLPKGKEFYEQCLKWQTTSSYTAEEIHQLGLQHVKHIHENVTKVVKVLNSKGDMTLDASKTPQENLKIIAENEKFVYKDTDEDREECMKEYRNLLEQISAKVRPMFNIIPSSKCLVKPMPKAMGEGGAGACYFTGSMDLTRPGMFYANLTNIKSQNKSQMKTLTAHEAVPGHHFQCSLQIENTNLPYFRRCSSEDMFTAYVEGWGLYAEFIGNETGFYNDHDGAPGYSVLGFYCADLLRSSRLVVDTGLHKMQWSRQQAIDFMIENAGLTLQEAEDEVDRYCVLPAQACAYKIGQLKLLELRRKLENSGGKFDITKFHDKVLEVGPVPLDILEEILLNEPC